MAKQLKIEKLERAKQRVKSAFKPEEADPVVRFILGGKMGLKHLMSEKVVVQPEYDMIELPGKEDLVVALKDGMFGFVSQSGKKGIPCIYKFAEGFGCSRAIVKKADGEQLFIDENGDFVFALGPGVSAHRFENGMVTLYSNKLEAVADKSGRKIVPFCKMVDRHDSGRYPAYVFYHTDFSNGRKDMIKRDMAYSSDEKQIREIFEAEIAENMKKGWEEVK